MSPVELRLNVSRLNTFLACEQLAAWKYRENIVPKRDGAIEALDLGTAIHKALESYYGKEARLDEQRALEAFHGELKEEEQRGYGEKLLRAYFKHWGEQDKEFEIAEVEREREVVVGEMEGGEAIVVLVGRPDAVWKHPRLGNGWWHGQHKTIGATVGMEAYVRKYDLAWHERGYRMLLEEEFQPYRGTILNGIRKLKNPGPECFTRTYVPVGEELVERFKRDALRVAKRWWEVVVEGREAVQNPQNCGIYNRLCEYWGLCCGGEMWKDAWGERERDYVDGEQRSAT